MRLLVSSVVGPPSGKRPGEVIQLIGTGSTFRSARAASRSPCVRERASECANRRRSLGTTTSERPGIASTHARWDEMRALAQAGCSLSHRGKSGHSRYPMHTATPGASMMPPPRTPRLPQPAPLRDLAETLSPHSSRTLPPLARTPPLAAHRRRQHPTTTTQPSQLHRPPRPPQRSPCHHTSPARALTPIDHPLSQRWWAGGVSTVPAAHACSGGRRRRIHSPQACSQFGPAGGS